MQMSYGQYWNFLVDFGLFKRISRKCIPSGLIYAKKRHFQPSVKWWIIIKQVASKQ